MIESLTKWRFSNWICNHCQLKRKRRANWDEMSPRAANFQLDPFNLPWPREIESFPSRCSVEHMGTKKMVWTLLNKFICANARKKWQITCFSTVPKQLCLVVDPFLFGVVLGMCFSVEGSFWVCMALPWGSNEKNAGGLYPCAFFLLFGRKKKGRALNEAKQSNQAIKSDFIYTL